MSCPINQGVFPVKHSIYFPSINSHFPSSMVVIWHKINSFSNQYILVLYIRMVAIFHINPYSISHQTWVFFHNVDWNHIWFSRPSAPLGREACVAVFGAPASIQAEKKTYCLGKWLEPSWCLEKSTSSAIFAASLGPSPGHQFPGEGWRLCSSRCWHQCFGCRTREGNHKH